MLFGNGRDLLVLVALLTEEVWIGGCCYWLALPFLIDEELAYGAVVLGGVA